MTDFTPIWISLKTATTATLITMSIGMIAARWMLGYRGKGKSLIEAVFTAPLVLPPTVVGFLLLLLLGKNGFLGQLLDQFGLTVIFSWYATVIASTVVAFPLMYKTALSAFQQIDANLIACARTLGASEWTIFWRILIPLAQPGLVAGTLLTFARALGEFGATLMLAGSIPGKTETIPIAIFLATEAGAMDRALVLVMIMLVISLGVITGVNYWTEGQRGKHQQKRDRAQTGLANNVSQVISIRNTVAQSKPPRNPSIPPTQFELQVEIQKQRSNFYLDVAFSTDQTPLGILGASGAGKSTIVRCIAGLETPDQGRIVLNGRVLYDAEAGINLPPRDRGCGFLFQNYALFPHLTVAENIAFGMKTRQSSRLMKQEVEQHLIAVNLAGMGNRYPNELSGGQQQRVALARVQASQPDILLLDEPFSALDTYLRDQQEKLLRQSLIHYQGVTLFITHNLEEAYRVCPNLLIVDEGKVIANGTKQAIFEHPPNYRTAQLTGCKNFSHATAMPTTDNAPYQIHALDWNCLLNVIEPIPPSLSHVGIRAHQLLFPTTPGCNTFPCWLATLSETQHRMTLYLKLHQPALHPEDYHLQAEVFKDQWQVLKERPLPWQIKLSELRLILLNPV